jgi:hypothetical protein
MRATWFCLGLIAILALAAPGFAAEAPAAEKPAPKLGDVREYTKRFVTIDCKRWEVKELNKDGYAVTQCGDNLAYIDPETSTVARIVSQSGSNLLEFKPRSPTLAFPLQVGKKWEGDYEGYRASNGTHWKSHVTCQAKAFERIKVAAGEFEAYRVECEDAWEATPFHGFSDSVSWYAPTLGTIVKSTNTSQSDFDFELAGYGPR